MSRYTVYGLVEVELDPGLAAAAKTFARELAGVEGPPVDAVLPVRLDPTIEHRPEIRFGVTGAMQGDRFLYPDGRGHYCSLDLDCLGKPGSALPEVDVCCAEFSANVLLEWIVLPLAYVAMADAGWAPLHASGLASSGEGGAVVFAAWSGVGKTNLVLSRLATAPEARYLGDDIVLVHGRGAVRPSTRTVSAYGYNRQLLGDLPLGARAKMQLADGIRRVALSQRLSLGRLQNVLLILSSGLANRRIDVRRARVMSDFVERPVTTHVRCVSASQASEPTLRELHDPGPGRAAAHLAVLEYEFIQFRRLIETWRWATETEHDPWTALRTAWRRNLERFFAVERRYFELVVPHTTDPEQAFGRAWVELDDALRT